MSNKSIKIPKLEKAKFTIGMLNGEIALFTEDGKYVQTSGLQIKCNDGDAPRIETTIYLGDVGGIHLSGAELIETKEEI